MTTETTPETTPETTAETLVEPAQPSGKPSHPIDRFFEITKRGSTVGTEVRGGIVTFVTIDRKSVV